jgi:thiosulfate/3-mercaptopyruvate sulfurtransferase
MTDYARPDLLASTDWLAEHLDDPTIRIVDCDELIGYQRLHIQGAIGLRYHHYFKEDGKATSFHLMGPEKFAEVMSSHGIGSENTVVAYDNSGGVYAARLWWALDYYGHSSVKLLNGGFRSWYDEGRPVTQSVTRTEKATFQALPGAADTLCTIDDVKAAIEDPNVVIWDVRSKPENEGTDDRPNKRHGRIPGAVHLEWLEMTEKPWPSGKVLPADDIRAKLDTLGITHEKTVYTH